jgi:O-antigen ligase
MAMRWLFVALIVLLMVSDFHGVNPGLGPGLSAKNAMLYLVVMVLTFRIALTGGFRMRMPGLHLAWAVWVGYAMLTWLIVSLVLKYHGYDPIVSAMALKAELIDYALYCFVIFYGVQTEDDFRFVLRTLLAVVGISSILTLTDLVGITSLGMKVGERGAEADRVFGAFGHANETGSLLSCMLPPLVAIIMSSRGFARAFWLGCGAASAAVFILTVSRGSYVAVLVGYPIAAYMLRSYIAPGRIMIWMFGGVGAVILIAVATAIIDPGAAAAIGDRVFDIGSMNLHQASSGRSDIWGLAVATMMDSPLTLITGFGWNAWSTMPTVFVLHNTYLDQWFNLGVFGVATYAGIEYLTIVAAKRAVATTTGPMQWDMMAYVFGMLALSIAVFFQNLYTPRPYLWMYCGLLMRAVVLLSEKVAEAAPARAPAIRLGVGVSLRKA